MSSYTYEFKDKSGKLEQYEWDNVWWENADKSGVPRVLYIGDSISCATRRIATEVSAETIYFDGIGTSKAVDNPYFKDTVRLFAAQEGEREVVLFNNGLHGWQLDDEGAYRENYEDLVKFLVEEFKESEVILVLTTAVTDAVRDARTKVRNRAVSEIAEKYGLEVIDLYSLTDARRDLISSDGVHLLPEGYKILASALVEKVREVLDKK